MDAICVLHCLDALEEGGRMAVVVPEGFLFKKQLKEVRKFLLSKANLELVVSLPQGVFQPYTGVKTDILYFTNAHKPQQQEVYYYFEVKNDGFTLDAHRRKIDKINDIHKLEASNIKRTEKELLKEQGFEFIDLEKVKNNDYNIVKLGEVCSIDWGNTKLTKEIYLKNGKYKVFSASGSDGLSNNFEHTGEAVILSAIAARCGKCFYAQDKWTAIKNTIIIKPLKNQEIVLKYLFYILNNEIFWSKKGGAQPFITLASARNQYLPLPSLEEQQKIVDELDIYQKIIDGTRQAVDSYKPYLSLNDEWKIFKIAEICDNKAQYGISKEMNVEGRGFKILRMGNLQAGSIDTKGIKYVDISNEEFERFRLDEGDILFNRTNSFELVGKTSLFCLDIECCFASYLIRIKVDKSKVLPEFLNFFMNNDFFQQNIKNQAKQSNNQANINARILLDQRISIPSLPIQQEIVEQLETERKMIESQKEIIKLFEKKCKTD